MTKTNDAARVLCPRACCDCCCQEHHWGSLYSNDEDEDDNTMGCKHCDAAVDYNEKCTVCGLELIDHEFDDDWSCPSSNCKAFKYKGQPERKCNRIHPWDQQPDVGLSPN